MLGSGVADASCDFWFNAAEKRGRGVMGLKCGNSNSSRGIEANGSGRMSFTMMYAEFKFVVT